MGLSRSPTAPIQWNTSLFIDGQVEVKKRTQAFLWAAVYEDKKKENTTGRKQKKFMFNVSRQELFSFHTSPFLLPQTSCSGLASLVDNRSEAWVLGGSREDTFSCRRSVCLKVAVTPHGHNNKHQKESARKTYGRSHALGLKVTWERRVDDGTSSFCRRDAFLFLHDLIYFWRMRWYWNV